MTPSNYKYGSISSHDDPEPGDHEIKHDSASCTCLAQLRRWNWKNITTISCLWLAYLLCNMSYSIVGPFFPDEVHIAEYGNYDLERLKLRSHESSNPGSTHFRSRTEFQSTKGCGLSQPGLQSGLGALEANPD